MALPRNSAYLAMPSPNSITTATGSLHTQSKSSTWLRPTGPTPPATMTRSLVVDLHNSASFPTLAVGILLGALREAGHQVELLSPLAHDVVILQREHRETFWDDWKRRLHLSRRPILRPLRNWARKLQARGQGRPHPCTLQETARALESKPDVLLLSAYLRHYPTVMEIGRLAQEANVPILLGGPVFNLTETANQWLSIPGLTAIVGAEVDRSLPAIIEAVVNQEDLLQFPGVTLPDGRTSGVAPPLRALDRGPIPDFSDFPWDRYPVRVIPILAARGCQWGRCTFCSDVVTTAGRTFRTRPWKAVLHEMTELAERNGTKNFQFMDLKLNSDPAQMRGLIQNIQAHIPGARWIAAVHVDERDDSGLSASELKAAATAGMRRISFGLESGSQRLLDQMDKGCRVEINSQFIHDAHAAGLSVRCTMFRGYPGETAEDLMQTADFLEKHALMIDRVRFNEFTIHVGTPIHQVLNESPTDLPELEVLEHDPLNARLTVRSAERLSGDYHRALARALRAVYQINRQALRPEAAAFDGLM